MNKKRDIGASPAILSDKEFLLSVLRKCQTLPHGRLFLFLRKGKKHFEGMESLAWPRINISLEGGGCIGYWEDGRFSSVEFVPGDVNFMQSNVPVYVSRHGRCGISIVLRPKYLRIVYMEMGENGGKDVIRCYHIYDTLGNATIYAFRTLDELQGFENDQEAYWSLISLIYKLAIHDLEASRETEESRARRLFQYMADFCAEHLASPCMRKLLAQSFQVTPEYVSRLFQRYTPNGLQDFLTRRRLDHAVLLLSTGRLSVKEVAFQCGFSQVSYFIKLFREYQHISPGQFKGRIP